MKHLLNRLAGVVVGIFLLLAATQGGADTVLGLYLPNSANRFGFDLAKVAIDALGLWAIYRGIRPKRKPEAKATAIS